MSGSTCFCCKFIWHSFLIGLCTFLIYASLKFDYQHLFNLEHIRFRSGFPSQSNWIDSPIGTLRCYLFNVTNPDAFLNGTDEKLKLEEIGPIVYRITGKNIILNQTESTITYQKHQHNNVVFDPEASISPDILNRTVILPNLVLLGAAAKLHDWVLFMRFGFNAVTINTPVFLNESVYYFLWNFKVPELNLLAKYVPNLVANCGMLHNALRPREKIYNVKIGTENGMENFFRVNTLNSRTFFPEHYDKLHALNAMRHDGVHCPIHVTDSYDNSLFSPMATKDTERTIIASEACRTLKLVYNNTKERLGFQGYEYKIGDVNVESHCLDNSMGIKLHKGMFDVTKCLFNDVPSALSPPHFFGTSYNWSMHFEGLSPDANKHETTITIEPITGIPIEEKYRFQSNLIMPPDMRSYTRDIERFSNIVIPTFWYEFELDILPAIVLHLMHFNIFIVPVLQPICIVLFIILLLISCVNMYLLFVNKKWRHLLTSSKNKK